MAGWFIRAWIGGLFPAQVEQLTGRAGAGFEGRDPSGRLCRFLAHVDGPTAADALAEFHGLVAGAAGDDVPEQIEQVQMERSRYAAT